MGEKQKHCGSDLKTLWERFKNTVGAIQKHCGSVKVLPQCFCFFPTVFWKVKHETKNET